MYDFEFVRRERNIISTPVVTEYHQWDFDHVKYVCGTGRIYVRLTIDREEITGEMHDEITGEQNNIGLSVSVGAQSVSGSTLGVRDNCSSVSTLATRPKPSVRSQSSSGLTRLNVRAQSSSGATPSYGASLFGEARADRKSVV